MIQLNGPGPLYRRLYNSLRESIIAGHYQSGERLPSSRALAKSLEISRNVVITCYEQLAAEGYLFTKIGAGSFVSPGSIKAPSVVQKGPVLVPDLSSAGEHALAHWQQYRDKFSVEVAPEIDFQYGPVELSQTVLDDLARFTRRCSDAVYADYQHPAGLEKLRVAIARYVQRNRACVCHPDQIVITNGSQQALDLIARLLLNRGDRVLIEDPCYRGARQVFNAAGAQIVACEVDNDGLNPALFPNIDRENPIKLLYSTPSHQFPTGAVLSLPRRLALLKWAHENKAYIIEDDYDSEFRYAGRPIEAIQGLDQNARTIYVGTFSKMVSSSLRLGYMVLPESLLEPMLSMKWSSDRSSPLLTQCVMAAFINSPQFARHIKRMRKIYAQRREVLIRCLEREMGDRISVQGTKAGIHLLVWLNNHTLSEEPLLLEKAREQGVGIYTVSALYAQSVPHIGLLMGYGNIKSESIKEGVTRLSKIIQ